MRASLAQVVSAIGGPAGSPRGDFLSLHVAVLSLSGIVWSSTGSGDSCLRVLRHLRAAELRAASGDSFSSLMHRKRCLRVFLEASNMGNLDNALIGRIVQEGLATVALQIEEIVESRTVYWDSPTVETSVLSVLEERIRFFCGVIDTVLVRCSASALY